MPFRIVRDDICHLQVDAIVNAANERLRRGGGVCGAIFAAAGADDLQRACDEIGHCATGDAVATPAFKLHARYVIHTVGPVWRGGFSGEQVALQACYRNSLVLASELGCSSIAFPLISSGIYGYPKDQAVNVAISTIKDYLDAQDMDVTLVVFDREAVRVSKWHEANILQRIDDVYVSKNRLDRRSDLPPWSTNDATTNMVPPSSPARFGTNVGAQRMTAPITTDERKGLIERLRHRLEKGFSETLLDFIDRSGKTDAEVYKGANVSRQHFSKIRSNKEYQPKKQTVLALAVSLHLNPRQTDTLLHSAGYALSNSDMRDIVVGYYIDQGIYDITEINTMLYHFNLPQLA